ncbi:MAG: hypothetical protein GC204_14175 [Chloroflexi bacterium]|nr:hypothetical protein [Chloroflexota bacterium]
MQFNANLRRDAIIVIAAVLIGLLYIAAAGGNFPLDDSWIHQTYGRNLAEYGQWAFYPGIDSAASTSPLYTVVLSAGYKLNIEYHLWTHGLGILALALSGLIGARLAAMVAPGRKYLPLAAGLALVLAWHLVWAAVSGMETMIFCLLTLTLIWLSWRELEARSKAVTQIALRGAMFGVIAGLATLTRPEGVLLAGLIGLALLIVRPNMTWRTLIIWGGAAIICFGIVLTPYLIFNLRVTGGLLPNTAAAKRAEGVFYLAQGYLQRVVDLLTPLAAGGQLLLVPGMIAFGALLPRKRESILRALLLVWPTALILLYAATLPLAFQHGRYVMPALPGAIIAGVVGMGWLLRRTRSSLLGRVVVRSLAGSAALVFALFAVLLGLQAYVQDVTIIDQEMVTAALWIKDNLPPDDLLVVHDIGAVGYFAPRPVLDIGGLISPEVVPLIHNPDAIWNLIQERGGKYLMVFDLQIPSGDVHDPHLCPVPVFKTKGTAALRAGGSNMTIYLLSWDGQC